jgi:biopolymer transport protein ExbD
MGRRRTREAPIEIVLPITPMLDMSFQLLAFFVMTFRVLGPAEGELDMYLPKAGEAKAKVPDAVDLSKTSDADIDQSSDLSVVIEATSGGDVSKLLVKDKAASHPVDDVKALQAKLKQMRGDLANKGNIKIEAESKLKYARLIAVMDACLAAGFTQVGFAPPPDLGSK